MTIHYVTNDPRDGIFAKAAETPRIRAYYIGPVKIIPLMMKMDADMVVMTTPDLGTYHLKRSYVKKDVEYVYIDHGPTSIHMCYRKNAFDNFDTVMANGPAQVAEYRAMERIGGLREKRIVETGYPLLDGLLSSCPLAESQHGRRIMIAPSYQADCIPDSCLDKLIETIISANPGCTVVFRPHPQYVKRFPAKMQVIAERYRERDDVVMEDDFSRPSTIDRADVLVTDWSGIAYEYAFRTKRPVVFVDTPMKVINPEWQKVGLEPTDIFFRNEVGVSVPLEDIPAAGRAVAEMLANPDRFAAKIEALLNLHFFNPGHAGEVAGKYILDALIKKQEEKRK